MQANPNVNIQIYSQIESVPDLIKREKKEENLAYSTPFKMIFTFVCPFLILKVTHTQTDDSCKGPLQPLVIGGHGGDALLLKCHHSGVTAPTA